MDSSSSSEELSSSECEIESSCEDDSEKFETAKICGATLQLPEELCENKDIFKEFFSLKTWNSLSEINKQHLKNFLPCFPENDDQEKNVTLQKLFNKEKFRFNSPLMHFHDKLKAGHFRPDIAKMKSLMKHAQRKENKYQQQRYLKRLISRLLLSRQQLLDVSNSLPPGIEPRIEQHSYNTNNNVCPVTYRTKRRYFQELGSIRTTVDEASVWSEDENYPEGPPVQLSKKQKRHLNGLQGNATLSSGAERAVISTMASKPTGLDLENSITSTYNPYQINEDTYRSLLIRHKKRKAQCDISPELNTKGLNVKEIASRTQLTPIKKSNGKLLSNSIAENRLSKKKIKPENVHKYINSTTNHSPESSKYQPPLPTSSLPSSNSEPDYSDSDSFIDPVMSPVPMSKTKTSRARTPKPKQTSPRNTKGKSTPVNISSTEFEPVRIKSEFEPINIKTETDNSAVQQTSLSLSTDSLVSPISQFGNRIVPTLTDLDGIDMMNLPVDLEHSNIDILEGINVKQELMQDTHANFLSLFRDIICSTVDHRMSLSNIEERLRAWQENPISPLNDWYSLVDNWLNLLPSAINFLTGDWNELPEGFVPYLEYKPLLQVYQWIGAGRDTDNRMSTLCQYWLEHRDDSIMPNNSQDIEIDVVEKPQTPPPPRCPTQWTVRKAEPEEIEQFREQERQRYSNPHKAFTYRMNGYESIVGPLKGMYNQSAGVSKARGHSMLNADRPNFVTILTLVRDATARLPNGEGTRADICELLKSSQYISQSAPENVLQSVVSGALDRMHTEFDPCVKYDTKKKIWIYLHRNRSEADFERIHQQCQGMSKQLKKATRKNKAKPKQEKISKQNAKNSESQPTITATTTLITNSSEKSQKAFKTPICRIFTVPTVSSSNTNVQLPAASPNRQAPGTSLLVNSNILPTKSVSSPKPVTQAQILEKTETIVPIKSVLSTLIPASSVPTVQSDKQLKIVASTIAPTKQDIEEAIQTLTPIRVASPITKQISSPKSGKSLVKIINTPQNKSLISPTVTNSPTPQQQAVFIKQIDQKSVIGTKQLLAQPQTTQQLLQSIVVAQQQKQLKTAQQIVQINQQKQTTVTTQQQQQLLKTVEQKPVQTIASQQLIQTVTHQPQTTTVSQAHIPQQLLQALNQQKNQTNTLTTAQQQQQLLQTIKQKVTHQNPQTLLTVQQAVLKQHTNIQQLQKQLQQQQITKGTSLLGQQRIISQVGTAKSTAPQNQTPLVAKVLTNAAGQVISVESLLAHQKQHGTLPQGTTLRVSGAKPGQTNLIQLAGSTANQMTQFTVVSQNSIVSVAGQQRLITTPTNQQAATTSTVTVVSAAKTLNKNHTKSSTTKFIPSKLTHQLVNAKFITQNITNNKLVPQQKLLVNQQNQIKISTATKPVAVTKTVASTNQSSNTVRMVNAAGLNLAHIAGKPVLLASKANAIQNIQGQNVILQTQHNISTSSGSIVIPNSARVLQGGNVVTQQQSQQPQTNAQVVLGTQLKVQNVNQSLVQTNSSQVVLGHNLKQQNSVSIATQPSQNQTVVLGGHTIKMQTATQSNQRVVLASQGQGGQLVAQQILLPPGFQGGAINIKTLQGLKVIPLTQTQQTKGRPQQVFARIMNPTNASRITQVPSTQSTTQLDGGGNQTSSE